LYVSEKHFLFASCSIKKICDGFFGCDLRWTVTWWSTPSHYILDINRILL